MAGAFIGQDGYVEAQPYRAQQAAAKVVPLRSEDYPPFRLRVHPMRWVLDRGDETDTPEWLPCPSVAPISPGVGNVDQYGSTALSDVIAAERGWVTLAPDVVADQPYIVVYPGIGGPVHLLAWQRLRYVGTQVLLTPDKAAARRWRRELVKRGVVALDPAVRDLLTEKARATHQRERQAAGRDPVALDRAADMEARLAAVDGVEVAVKPKRGPRKAPAPEVVA